MLQELTAGESHGPALTAILAGLPAGVPVDEELIARDLARRQLPLGAGGRMAIERDRARIMGGVMEGVTTGAPVALQILNADHAAWRDREVPPYTVPRPGHADLAAVAKYGYADIRPALERASARETASRVAIGALCRAYLRAFGIEVGGVVTAIGSHRVRDDGRPWPERVAAARASAAQVSDPEDDRRIAELVAEARKAGETLGGIIEVGVTGVPVGLGSHVTPDRRLDARLAQAVLSVPAIKGFEMGEAFTSAGLAGTRVHDPITAEAGRLVRTSDRCGGVEGGITTGARVWFRAAMKPIPTTLRGIPTVDLATGQPTETRYERSDICPVPRAVVVLEAVAARVIADALLEKLGGDSLAEQLPRFQTLRGLGVEENRLTGRPHRFWETSREG